MTDRLILLFVLIRKFEGCRLMPYLCPAGIWTCGYGATGLDVFPGQPWTQEYAEQRLQHDAIRFAKGAIAACPILATENDNRLCAIADFAFNLGIGTLRGSTLRKRINAGEWKNAQQEIIRWIHGGGKTLPGLVARRKAESLLLLS